MDFFELLAARAAQLALVGLYRGLILADKKCRKRLRGVKRVCVLGYWKAKDDQTEG